MKSKWKKLLAAMLAFSMVMGSLSMSGVTANAQGDPTQTNHALSATATADSHEDAIFAASKANDGVINRNVPNTQQSRWASAVGVTTRWLKLDFGSAKTVQSVVIDWERCNATNYKIQYSNNNSSWEDVATFTAKPTDYTQIINFSTAVNARYIRLLINNFDATGAPMNGESVNWATVSVYEFEAYSQPIANSNVTINSVVSGLQVPEVPAGATKWSLPEVPGGFEIEFIGADYEQVIDRNLTIYQPIVDTTVAVNYKVSKGAETRETSAYTVTVPGKYTVEESDNAKPIVIPELAEWKGHTGDFTISKDTKLVINPEYQDELAYVAESFAADYEDLTGNAIEVTYGTAPEAGDFYFTLGSEDAGLKEEGYLMTIADYVTVEAVDKTGAFWAIQTIMQILKQTEDTMPKGITRDYPKFEVRGLLLDVGRKPFEMHSLYEVLKTMAYYKLNDICLHLNDNYIWVEEYNNTATNQWGAYSAFRLESDIKAGGTDADGNVYQADLTASDLYYKKDEFRQLILDAREMGIDVVPEFDAPAHSLAFTKVRPDLALKQGTTNRWADHFDLSNPGSEKFIKQVWSEYMEDENPVFDQDTILNIGTDEYEGSSDDFRNFSKNMINFVQDSGRTVRLWGSLTAKASSVVVPHEDVQMYIWNTGWANPSQMYNEGYELINIQDGYVYMVPNGTNNRGGYGDRLNLQSIYDSWKPNVIGGATIPAGSDQMLGGCFAIWQDNIDRKETGLGDYDTFDRFNEAAPYIATKAWGEGTDMGYTDFQTAVGEIGTAPGINPYGVVESKNDKVAEYKFEDNLNDSSRNKYHAAEGANIEFVAGKEGQGLKLNGGSSYVTTPNANIGPASEISFWLKKDADGTGEQILFESEKAVFKAVMPETGKFGFTRVNLDYSFDYTIPNEEWVHIALKSYVGYIELYVNGELEDTLGKNETGGLYATVMFPTATIGSKTDAFKGIIDEVVIVKTKEVDDSATRIPTDGFKVTTDNENPLAGSEGPISLAFDGNVNTFWHSNYTPYKGLPATVEINMGKVYTIDQFDYLTRPSGVNGNILECEIYTKAAANEGYTLLTTASWTSASGLKKINFDPIDAQYIKLVVTKGATDSGNMFASAAEFYIHEYDSKTELRVLYEEAAEYENADDYTAESWSAFDAARTAALAVLEDEAATADDIANAIAGLQEAMDNLTEKSEEPDVPDVPDKPVVPTNPFEDVYESDYYYEPVLWAVENGITDGWTETLFAPNMGCTRGQVVTFLWRAAGEPEATNAENPFADVAENAYYYDAVLWAVENGITDGWTATTFAPDMTCTRGQIVTFIWRAAGEPTAEADENPFVDVAENAYYYDAVLWAVENGITDGWTPEEFAPDMECTRGQVVTFLHRAE